MRKSLGAKPYLFPMPVLMIATYNEDGSVDCMNAAWGGTADYEKIAISLDSSHKTTDNIIRNKEFTVSIGIKEYVTECDYLGIVSGKQVKDKFAKSGFHAIDSEKVHAPTIKELPLTLECTLDRITEEEGLMIGNIVNVTVDDSILTDGKIDMKKFHVITFDQANNTYIELGEKVADAFKIGLKLK